ncbi:hypothetical protein LNQ52_25190 [Klebsiella pneumoniae subsp. pneumoniae]|nr:hypothetical protein [Klebsiella pneumoniae subsp. pneumoniae]
MIDGQTVIGAKPIFPAEIARHPVDALSDSARFLTYGMVKIFGTAGMAPSPSTVRRNRRISSG